MFLCLQLEKCEKSGFASHFYIKISKVPNSPQETGEAHSAFPNSYCVTMCSRCLSNSNPSVYVLEKEALFLSGGFELVSHSFLSRHVHTMGLVSMS